MRFTTDWCIQIYILYEFIAVIIIIRREINLTLDELTFIFFNKANDIPKYVIFKRQEQRLSLIM